MQRLLTSHHAELIERCASRGEQRGTNHRPTHFGTPVLLRYLEGVLDATADLPEARAKIEAVAKAHGEELYLNGTAIEQVVFEYGDVCQSITELAMELDLPLRTVEFQLLNKCLDDAIATAVKEYAAQRDAALQLSTSAHQNERLGRLLHELRNAVGTATLALAAIEAGGGDMRSPAAAVLGRGLAALRRLVNRSLEEIRGEAAKDGAPSLFDVAGLLSDTRDAARLDASARGKTVCIDAVDSTLRLRGNRDNLMGALANLLGNALKFTQPGTAVRVSARAAADRVLIDVEDRCGGLPASAEQLFTPFCQRSSDRSGLGLGLTIARAAVEAEGGTLTVRDVFGTGCIFTMNLPAAT